MEKHRSPVADVALQLPETTTVTTSWSLRKPDPNRLGRVRHAVIRALCLVSSVVCLTLMLTSEEEANVSLYGIQFPVSSKWTFSNSFEYLVGVSAAVSAHSLVHIIIHLCRLRNNAPLFASRNHLWFDFIGDQVFAYAMISAASSAAGVSNLNRTGIKHTALPNFCKPLHAFCSHVTASIVFAFFSAVLLAASSALDVILLSSNP